LTSDNITIPSIDSLFTQLGTYQIVLWVYQNNSGINRNVFNFGGGGSNRHNLNFDGTGIGFNRYNGSNYVAKKITSPGTNRWIKIVCKNNAGVMTLKVNNNIATDTNNNYAASPGLNNLLYIGYPNSTTNGSGSIDGKLDEFRVYSALTSDNYDTTEYNNQNDPASFLNIELYENIDTRRSFFLDTCTLA